MLCEPNREVDLRELGSEYDQNTMQGILKE